MHGDLTGFSRRQERFRGLMIGLALGDACADVLSGNEVLRAGAATDLAMRQIHAMIRSWRPPNGRAESTLINATMRDLKSYVHNTEEPTTVQLDPRPWFARNPLVWQRRGNPRATVEAVENGLELFGGRSKGVHGMIRVAPLAALWLNATADEMKQMVALSASLTHDMEFVGEPSILLCTTLARLATGPSNEQLRVISDTFQEAPVCAVDAFLTELGGDPSLDHINAVAPNGQAHRELAAALYLASCDVDLEGALGLASQAKDPDGVGALTGALIGASSGVTPWMEEQFAKHEFAWQIEVLVRDLFMIGLSSDEPLEELLTRYPQW